MKTIFKVFLSLVAIMAVEYILGIRLEGGFQ